MRCPSYSLPLLALAFLPARPRQRALFSDRISVLATAADSFLPSSTERELPPAANLVIAVDFLLPCLRYLQHFCWNMGTLNSLWLLTRKSVTGALFGITISDRYLTVSPVRGNSMHPTFASSSTNFPGYLKGDLVLIERFCLHDFKFSHGDVVIFQSPSNHRQIYVKRLIALSGEWIRVSSDMVKIPDGHCWVEGDNSSSSLDSRSFGPIPLGLIRGRVTHIIWPPQRLGKVERKSKPGRIYED